MTYPDLYKRLNSSDWNTIKDKLEKFYSCDLLERIPDTQNQDCQNCIMRCFHIEWSVEQKKEIAFYTANYVKRCLDKEHYLDGVERELEPDKQMQPHGARFLPIMIMELSVKMMEKLDDNYEKILNEIWLKSKKSGEFYVDIRLAVLGYLRKNVDNNLNIPDIFKRWFPDIAPADTKIQTIYNKYITDAIEEILFMYNICQCKTDNEIVTKALKNVKNEGININYFNFGKTISMVYKVRPDIEPLLMLKFQNDKMNLNERYVLTAWGYILVLERLHNKRQISDQILSQLKSASTKLSQEWQLQSIEPPLKKERDLNQIYIPRIEKLIAENKNNKQTEKDKKPITQTNTESNTSQEKNIQESDDDVIVIRPEDQGEDFSLLDNAENFKRLTTAEDKFERWKAAKVLGTRFIDGKFKPTQDEQNKINEYVAFLLTQFNTNNPGDAGDASAQLWRLWSLAISGLLQGLKNKDRIIWNVALEHLVIFRNENIVETLIKEYDKAGDEEYKQVLLDALGKMRTKYDNRFPYRKMLNSKKSAELADKLITPFLERISVTEKSEVLQNAIETAKKYIADPIDSRMLSIDPATGEKKPIIEEEIDPDQSPPPPTPKSTSDSSANPPTQ
ncbi:MAG: hypothetical protein LBC74_00755, partial [Planctomycetaceae bacterium]|nr:hypothetical protein [Planctomycetaceae bacterium]